MSADAARYKLRADIAWWTREIAAGRCHDLGNSLAWMLKDMEMALQLLDAVDRTPDRPA